MANNKKENKIEKFTKEAIGKTLNQFNKEIGIADLVEINKNQDRILNGILSQVNDENTEKTEKSNIITLDNSTDGIVELKEIQGDTNVNVSKIEEDMPITHDIGDKEGNVFTLNEIPKGAISIGEIQGNTIVNCNKDDKKELVLMKDLSTQGDSNITLNKGVDGGKVDIALEGNTMVNVCDQKDPIAITKSYTVETGNHVALQGEYDGKCRPVVTGNTLVNLVGKMPNTTQVYLTVDENYITILNGQNHRQYYYLKSTGALDVFKTNTTYTIIAEITKNTLEQEFVLINNMNSGNGDISATKVTIPIGFTGRFIGKFTTLADFTDRIRLGFTAGVTNIGEITLKNNFIILEGDYTNKPIPGYFEGLKSSFEDKVVPSPIADIGTCDLSQKANYLVEGNTQIKANTTYTLIYNSSIDTNELFGFQYVNSGYTYWNNHKKGLNVRVFKINEDKTIRVFGRGTTIEGLVVSNIYLFEGDYTNYDFSDYDPTKAGKYKVDYVVTGKNKVKGVLDGMYYNSAGDIQSATDTVAVAELIPVKPNKNYIMSSDGDYFVYCCYDIDKNKISRVNGKINITTPSNCYYVAFHCQKGTWLQLEEGTEATPYEPYKEYTKTFYLNSPLLEGDTIEQQGNNVVHVHRSEIRAYQTDDELTLPTDMTNTLVAKVTPQYEVISQSDTILCDSYVNGHLDVDSVVPIEKVDFKNTGFSCRYLYPSTKYNIQFESDNTGVTNVAFWYGGKISVNVIKGLNKCTLTTPSSDVMKSCGISYSGIGFNASNIVVTEATDQEFGYFEGMKSVGECEDLEVVSSNSDGTLSNTQQLTHEPLRAVRDTKDKYVLIDGKWYIERNCEVRAYQEGDIDNYITDMINTVYPLASPTYEPINYNPFAVYSDTTHISNNSTIPCNMIIKNTGYNCLLKPSTIYTVSSNLGLNTVTTPSVLTEDCLRFYDTDTSDVTTMKNVTILEGDYTTGKPIPSHFSGIESAFEQEYDETVGKYKVKIRVQNEDATKENYIEFHIDEPLRGIGDTKDKVYVKDDKVVVERNCASVTLDGSEDEKISIAGSSNASNIKYSIKLDNLKFMGINSETKIACNNFNYDTFNLWANIDKECVSNNNEAVVFRVSKLKAQNVAEFKQWLSENPTTVVYQLAEPTYEEVEYSESRLFLDTYNNSTLFYESNIPVSNTSFKSLWEELVYVKNSTKYYIQFNAVGSGEVVINLGGTELTTEIVEGYNCIPITTPSESTNLMTISGQGITISEVVVSEVICGGYYKGLQSCFEEHMENGKYRILLRGIALDGSKVNGIKLYINEPLRGVEDTKDRLCIKNGKLMVERKCGSAIFDGSDDEGWKHENIRFSISISNVVPGKFSKAINNAFFTTDYIATGNQYDSYIIINGWNGTNKLFLRDINKFINLAELKQYLQQNPLTIVYKAYKPIYEEVTNEYGLPIVFEGYENGIVYIDSAVTPTTHIKYTSNNQLATTLSEAEEQNISTQEDINMNVITYMMDIDMMLTDMEMSNDISVMAVRRDNNNENMLDRMSEEDKKVYQDNTVVMLEKMITAKALEKEDIERRIDMYYDKNRISKEQYKYLKSLL